MTVCKFPDYIKRYRKEIEFISSYDKENAPEGVYNVAAAMAIGRRILSFDENSVLVQDDDKSALFDIFNNQKDFVEIVRSGEYVISGNMGALPSSLLFPENRDLMREQALYRVQTIPRIEAKDRVLERAVGKCVLLRVLNDIDYRLTQNEVDIDSREVSRIKNNPYRHQNPYSK